MANFLELNGINVPVHVDGADFEPKRLQDSDRAENMALLEDERAIKGVWDLKVPIDSRANAFAYRQLVMGAGHYWSFDDVTTTTRGLYSSRGLGPTGAITGVTCTAGSAWLGAAKMAITSGNSVTFTLGPGLPGIHVMLAVNVNGAGFNHIIKDDGGTVYTNGVLTGAAAMIGITLATGVVVISAPAVNHTFDELVILPYRMPSSWPAQAYAFQNPGGTAQQWSLLRQLKLGGDVLPEGGRKVVHGSVGKERIIQASPGGVLQASRALEINFVEV